MIGQVIQNYRIVSNIGEGGMGNIFLASHVSLERSAAIKQLHYELTNNADFKQRFINEAKILAQLNHPNIITVYDLIEDKGHYFIIMEYVKGDTIDKVLEKTGAPLHHARALNIFIQILSAFDYAHSKGIVHRDIKPSNIILDENDTPKVLDFGIAKILQKDFNLTKAGTKMGSLLYMSPEQVMGRDVDFRSDIYSLGILLYEMLTATLPYNTNSEYEVMDSILKQPIPDLNLLSSHFPNNLGRLVNKACEKFPEDRFNSANDFINAIEQIGYKANKKSTVKVNVSPDLNKTVLRNNYQTYNYSKPEKKSSKYLLIILSIIIIAIATIFVLYSIFNKADDKIITQSKTQEEKQNNNLFSKININGHYRGTIKDGTSWEVEIFGFDGENFNGNNTIYWSFVKNPGGMISTFNGKFNKSDGTIEMYEDPSGKKTGKFIGKVSQDGVNVTGNWYRYSDNGSYSWNLTKY